MEYSDSCHQTQGMDGEHDQVTSRLGGVDGIEQSGYGRVLKVKALVSVEPLSIHIA